MFAQRSTIADMTAITEKRQCDVKISSLPKWLDCDGRAMLGGLAAELLKRKIPPDRYVKVNVATGEFVTGESAEEADRRFAQLHPGALGCMQRFGDFVAESGNGSSEK